MKAGGDEVLHTVMEIRQNPYDDFDEGNNNRDNTVDIAQSPFDNDLIGDLTTKKPPALPIAPTGGSKKNLFALGGGQPNNDNDNGA